MKRESERGDVEGLIVFLIVAVVAVVVILGLMFGVPAYSRGQRMADAENETRAKALDGEAELKKAEYTRKVATLEAQAKLDSSKLLAQVEVERAKGVAEANKIIGEGLKGHDEYLRYLWIMSLEHTAQAGDKVVYVPTEAQLPILEATRLSPPK